MVETFEPVFNFVIPDAPQAQSGIQAEHCGGTGFRTLTTFGPE